MTLYFAPMRHLLRIFALCNITFQNCLDILV